MKITFISPPLNMGGGTKVIAIYAEALTKRGHHVVIVSPAHPKITLKQRLKALINDREWLSQSNLNASHFDGLTLDNRVLTEFRAVTNSDVPDADIVIATWWETAEWVSGFTSAKGKKVYFIQGHEVFSYVPVERARATYKMPFRKVVVSQWLKNIMGKEYADFDVSVVNNAVDHEQFNAELRGKQKQPTVGFLYSEASCKGVDVTLKALEKIRGIFPELRVISFGVYEPRESLPGIEFYYSPPQNELRNLYSLCDVWVSSSRSEGFNLTAMEAMACRVPIVATRTGWPEESIRNKENGVLVDVDDVQGVVAGIEWVLSLNDNDWRTLSTAAYATVAECSWGNSIERFEQVLNSFIL